MHFKYFAHILTALLQASPPAKSPRGRPPAKNGKADDDDDEEDEDEDGDDDDGSDFDPGSEEDNKKKRVSLPMVALGRLMKRGLMRFNTSRASCS